jgi:hypothetical protein
MTVLNRTSTLGNNIYDLPNGADRHETAAWASGQILFEDRP